MTRDFTAFLIRKAEEYPQQFDSSDLAQKFVPAYKSGERIKVKFTSGEVRTGTVGVTTGWKPVFILMLTRRSHGSSYVLDNTAEIIN
jgi:hypothetical protein